MNHHRSISLAGLAVAAAVLAGSAACANDDQTVEQKDTTTTAAVQDASLTVAELLEQRPAEETQVRGAILAEGYEYFGEDEIGWDYDVELCESVSPGDGEDSYAECEGASVTLDEDTMSLELDWEFDDIGTQYTGEVILRGVLDDGDHFEVLEVVDSSPAVTVSTIVDEADGTSVTTDTVDSDPLPIDELAGEDLSALRLHLRNPDVTIIYLESHGFVERVQQLRANCESLERLQTVIDNMSSRGPEAPQDAVDQHFYVCPDQVQNLTVVDGVELPG